MRTITQAKRIVSNIDPSEHGTIYTGLAQWDTTLSDALEQSESLFRDVYWETVEEMSTAVKQPMLGDNPDWEYAQSLTDAYNPADRSNAHLPIVTVVGTGILEERFHGNLHNIPKPVYEYLLGVGREHPSDPAWEDASVVGWLIDHPEWDVAGDFASLTGSPHLFLMMTLKKSWRADQDAAFTVMTEAIESDDNIEDIKWFEGPDLITTDSSTRSIRYHDPRKHYPIETTLNEDVAEKLRDYIKERGFKNALQHHGLLQSLW
ncbi:MULTISPECIES: hypothetical protein [unclassified Haloferax]|uniref:hypothetical protein n=1 Tax=unclassified Haloferax TaxID=2625095 RepID=UPI00287B5C20|nr:MULTISPECIES: hypothetical protein [unclassified Haloferax]